MEEEIAGWLGLAALFEEFNLIQLHGQRYADNHLTVRFMSRFGFKDVGRVPRLLARGDEAIDGIISTLSREDFEANLEQRIAEATVISVKERE
jgi:RimJ/RimL family protein N-acetyltransferase